MNVVSNYKYTTEIIEKYFKKYIIYRVNEELNFENISDCNVLKDRCLKALEEISSLEKELNYSFAYKRCIQFINMFTKLSDTLLERVNLDKIVFITKELGYTKGVFNNDLKQVASLYFKATNDELYFNRVNSLYEQLEAEYDSNLEYLVLRNILLVLKICRETLKDLTDKMLKYKNYVNASIHRENMKNIKKNVKSFLIDYNELEDRLKSLYKPEYIQHSEYDYMFVGATGSPIKVKDSNGFLDGMRHDIKTNMGYLAT